MCLFNLIYASSCWPLVTIYFWCTHCLLLTFAYLSLNAKSRLTSFSASLLALLLTSFLFYSLTLSTSLSLSHSLSFTLSPSLSLSLTFRRCLCYFIFYFISFDLLMLTWFLFLFLYFFLNFLLLLLYCDLAWPIVAALRDVAIQRGTRAARAGGALAAAAFARHPSPLTATAAATLHGYIASP